MPSVPKASWWRNARFWIGYTAALGVLALIRGIARIGDGHRLTGWIFVGAGMLAVVAAGWAFWTSRSPAPPGTP